MFQDIGAVVHSLWVTATKTMAGAYGKIVLSEKNEFIKVIWEGLKEKYAHSQNKKLVVHRASSNIQPAIIVVLWWNQTFPKHIFPCRFFLLESNRAIAGL